MKKCIVCKLSLEIIIDVPQRCAINSSTAATDPSIEAVKGLNGALVSQANKLGFVAISQVPRYVSERNGGYAMYTTFKLEEPFVNLKILVDIRAAEHSSSPSLAEKTEIRYNQFFNMFPEYSNQACYLHIVDTYCKLHDWGLQVYVGKGDKYSKPVTSLESAALIVSNQLRKVIKDQFVSAIDSILSKYDTKLIEYAQSYLDDASNISVSELAGGEWQKASDDTAQELASSIRVEYLQLGIENDLFVDVADFDNVCQLVMLHDKYSEL